MSAPLSVRRLLEESRPLALCLGFWALLAWLTPEQELAFRVAGVVMAGAYAVVRGVALSSRVDPADAFATPESFLRTNVRMAAVVVAWVAAGALAFVASDLLMGLWRALGFEGLFEFLFPEFLWAFGAVGVGTVLLYAVAVVAAALDEPPAVRESTPAND